MPPDSQWLGGLVVKMFKTQRTMQITKPSQDKEENNDKENNPRGDVKKPNGLFKTLLLLLFFLNMHK